MSPLVGCVICGSDRHQAARCCAELREREMMQKAAEEIMRQSATAGVEVGRTPPRYALWRHALGWAFVLSVLGVGLWGAWSGLLWVVARLGAAWRGGG